MPVETEDSRIADGSRVAAFLAEPAVQAAIERLKTKYYEGFKSASTRDDLNAQWSKAHVLDDMLSELQAVQDSGTRASADKQRRGRGGPNLK